MPIDKNAILNSFLTSTPLVLGLDYMTAYGLNSFPVFQKVLKDPMHVADRKDELLHYLIHPIENMTTALSNEMFVTAQPVFMGLTLLMVAREMWSKRKGRYEEASGYGAHGTSRWATKEEIFDKTHISKDINSEGQLLALYNNKPIIQHESSRLNRNIAIFGGSGSGKSASYITGNILNTKDKSIVVTDPKGELYEKTSEAKRKQGYDVRLINFKDLKVSDRYNPLDYVREETDALKVAKTIIRNTSGDKKKGDFWDKAEESLLSAFILYVKFCVPKEKQHLGSVFNILLMPYKDIKIIFMELPEGHIAKRAYLQAIDKLEDKVRSNVFISLSVTMDLWKYLDVCRFTQTSDFDLQDIGKKKTIIYVIIPIAEEEFKPLISSFFTQLFSELYTLADHNFNKLPVPVRMMLDEFNNIGKIPNFSERLSTTRSYRIEVTMVIQSLGQLRDRYGKDVADELIDNCDIRLFLGTNALDSAKYFSQLIGKTTVRVQNISENKNGNGSSSGQSYQMTARDLMTPDELLRMEDDTAVVFIKGKYPIKAQKAWYSNMKHFNEMLGKEVSRFDYPAPDRGNYEALTAKNVIETHMQKEQPSFEWDEVISLSELMKESDAKKNTDSVEAATPKEEAKQEDDKKENYATLEL